MLSGAAPRAPAIAGTAVFKMVVSNDSMKNATATSHGKSRLLEVCNETVVLGLAMRIAARAYGYSVNARSLHHSTMEAGALIARQPADTVRNRGWPV
jgi:hypothetical protein